ncbi:uncharacterized protein LOC123543181 [Mercenaria mercenaria]|uniref:uncharacterized protein LOC123543181 n=1 Tax=Mercenaria mercenaria TaxID=6596 RepID=UPI00234F5C6F|nr:uncharacterized protein LOC123543181 [Mercenaria mercenaria]
MPENASRTSLTQYLHHIYDNDIQFKICDEGVSNIEKGVVSIVQYIATYALERCQEYVQRRLDSTFMKKIKDCKSEIIGVGSFYERTKNGFPDEFDFLFPICTLETDGQCHNWALRFTFEYIHYAIFRFSEHIDEHRKELPYNEWVIFKRLVERRGPSSKLEFLYKKCKDGAKETPLHVDLVPCIKIIFSPIDIYKNDFIQGSLLCKKFERDVSLTNSFVLVDHEHPVSFAETEVRFMREVLSDKHRKVYRLLKFLLNGKGDNEKLRSKFRVKGLCSYYIKCVMIYHHFKCGTENDNEEALCVLTVLRDLKCDLENKHVTLLTHVKNVDKYISTTEALKKVLGHLEKIQKSYKDRNLNLESAAKLQYHRLEKEVQQNIREERIIECVVCCVRQAVFFCGTYFKIRSQCSTCLGRYLKICNIHCTCCESCEVRHECIFIIKYLACICMCVIAVVGIIYLLIIY